MNRKLLPVAISMLLPLTFNANADVLRDGDELKLTYKNYYWNESAQRGDDGRVWGADRDEWIQAALLEYNSGFIDDWIRFEYGAIAADNLNIGSSATNITNLSDNDRDGEPDGLLGTQTAYIETRYQGEGFILSAGVGKKARLAPVYKDNTTRIIDATSVGYDLNAKLGNLQLYFTELNKMSQRNEDDWGEPLTNYSGERIDSLRYFGAQYRFSNGLSLEAAQAESEDYIRERMARARYMLPLQNQHSLMFGLSYGTLDSVGDLYNQDASAPFLSFFNDDLSASYHELSLGYRLPGIALSLNYSNVQGGDWNYNLVEQEFRQWDTHNQYAWSWFGLEGEDAISLLGMVDFSHFGVPGLRWNAGVWFSDDAKGFRDFKRHDFTSVLSYDFPGAFKGLNLSWMHSTHRAEGEIDGVNRTAYPLGPAGLERKDVNRLYIAYSRTF
ncbi:OprD family outer membrane porin [Marinobacterium mangrovicola]|uniref:Outer membrane OprD family porin n=1 Tax=Marinobacterium mangrovicola TaxID=1476959 RepID=A0A4R1H7P7_9GAMM|nr:OprD family outer membrane porin [Marinobacterium mangrovicola]TCK16403.1 outer membrane OprD family porin [Marinobacterium mangrovicola]